jgi:hypothetical protein
VARSSRGRRSRDLCLRARSRPSCGSSGASS